MTAVSTTFQISTGYSRRKRIVHLRSSGRISAERRR
jgi:hypothetical protein